MTILLPKICCKIPSCYGNTDEALLGITFYWHTLYVPVHKVQNDRLEHKQNHTASNSYTFT